MPSNDELIRLTDEVIDSLSGRELDEAVAIAAGYPILGIAAVTWIDGSESISLDREYVGGIYSLEPIIRNPLYTEPPVPEKGFSWIGSDGNQYSHEAQNLCGVPRMQLMAVPFYHRDLGDAMKLLLEFLEPIEIKLYKDGVNILAQMPGAFKVIASGPHEQMSLLLCRAFLKLKNRS